MRKNRLKKLTHILQTANKGYQVVVNEGYEGGRETKPFKTLEEAQQAHDKISVFFKQMFDADYIDRWLSIVEVYEIDGKWLDKWDIEYTLDDIDD